jgi:acyl carrier protein
VEDLLQLVGSILGVHDVAPSDRLAEDLEAESMDMVNIVAALEERHGVVLDEAVLAEVRTVADLHDAVQAAPR